MPQGAVSNGKHIDAFIPPDLRDMFYRHPTRPYAWNNGLDPYGFPTDGLVSYLPLWALKNSAFKSVDANRYTATVTGALWQPDGRAFDGDDFISVGTGVNINGTQSAGAWFKYNSYTDSDIIFSNTNGTILGGVTLRLAGATLVRVTLNVENLYYQLDKTVATGTWYFVMFTFDLPTTTLKYYLNGGSPSSDNTGTATARSVGNMEIGRRPQGGGVSYFDGNVGEVWFYSRALSAGEIEYIYDSTAWRYQ